MPKGTPAARGTSTTQPDLAEAISAMLNHPDLPADLYNGFRDILRNMPDEFMDSPVFIREQLRVRGVNVGGARAEADDAPFTDCAHVIADLLEASGTPEVLRSALDAFCGELANCVSERGECVCSPETARRHLPALLARAEERGMICPGGGVMLKETGAPCV